MDSVRTGATARSHLFDRVLRPPGARLRAVVPRSESSVLDIVFLLGVVLLFVLVGLLAGAVEKLLPPRPASPVRTGAPESRA